MSALLIVTSAVELSGNVTLDFHSSSRRSLSVMLNSRSPSVPFSHLKNEFTCPDVVTLLSFSHGFLSSVEAFVKTGCGALFLILKISKEWMRSFSFSSSYNVVPSACNSAS